MSKKGHSNNHTQKRISEQDPSFKETLDKIMQASSGTVKGLIFSTRAKCIAKKEGKDGILKLEKKITKAGYPFKFQDIKTFRFYPIGKGDILIVGAKMIFNWDEKDVFNLGYCEMTHGLFVRIFMKYSLLNVDKTIAAAVKIWNKYMMSGELKYELNKEKKEATLYLKYEVLHPLLCHYWRGAFQRIAEYIIKGENFETKEIACMFKGDKSHIFLISWE